MRSMIAQALQMLQSEIALLLLVILRSIVAQALQVLRLKILTVGSILQVQVLQAEQLFRLPIFQILQR